MEINKTVHSLYILSRNLEAFSLEIQFPGSYSDWSLFVLTQQRCTHSLLFERKLC